MAAGVRAATSANASEKTLLVLEAALTHSRFTDVVEATGMAKATTHRILGARGSPQSDDVTSPDTPSTTITGLTVGVPYRFTVAPLNVAGPGTPSNEVLATPLGAVGPPTVTATGSNIAAQVF